MTSYILISNDLSVLKVFNYKMCHFIKSMLDKKKKGFVK